MKGVLLNCEIGVLLTERDKEFQKYNNVYDQKFGYYDEDQTVY